MEQHLRVRPGSKRETLRLKRGAEVPEVVDLTVERHRGATLGTDHRLSARIGEIDDREAAMAEGDAARRADPHTLPVGTAAGHSFRDPADLARIDRTRAAVRVDAGNAAH